MRFDVRTLNLRGRIAYFSAAAAPALRFARGRKFECSPLIPSRRRPGNYYRGDFMKLEDRNWHCFALSRYDRETGKWTTEKAPVYHIVD